MEAGTPPSGPAVRSALWFPLFDELADPTVCAHLAAEAEAAGWYGFFVWDQLRWEAPVRHVADSWITLAAIAAATERLRLGPMVTPLPRRRPVKVARETATLDLLSGCRLTLGVGIGGDRFAREFSKTVEQLDERARGQMLDEALEILTAAWSGELVHHHGDHYTVDDIQFLPRILHGVTSMQRRTVAQPVEKPSGDAGSATRADSTRFRNRPRRLVRTGVPARCGGFSTGWAFVGLSCTGARFPERGEAEHDPDARAKE